MSSEDGVDELVAVEELTDSRIPGIVVCVYTKDNEVTLLCPRG